MDVFLQRLLAILRDLLALVLAVFDAFERWLRALLAHAGLPADVQRAVIVLVAVLFIVAAFRLLGGLVRLLLVILLVVLLLHAIGAMPHAGTLHL